MKELGKDPTEEELRGKYYLVKKENQTFEKLECSFNLQYFRFRAVIFCNYNEWQAP